MASGFFNAFSALCILSVALGSDVSGRFVGTRESHHGFLARRGPLDLFAELEKHQRSGDFDSRVTQAHIERLERALLPIFQVSVKDDDGRLGGKAARYALHRLFIQRHGWHVSGIELHGAARDTSTMRTVTETLGKGTFSLGQLAHFAATLETLVHIENMQRLQRAFDALGFSRKASQSSEEATKKVIEAYMAFYVTSWLPANASYAAAIEGVEISYAAWHDTRIFVEEIRQSLAGGSEARESLWDASLRVVEEVAERYGRWQNRDCIDLKRELVRLETPGTGRVPLHTFWAPLLKTYQWMFDESLPYLEQLGALEGEDAPYHSVVIPNYMSSSANCLAGSAYYDVCCLNECEALLGEIEADVQAPAASPEQLRRIISALASETVEAPRELPEALVRKLDGIAARHGGRVPLHGRLFAQFMHHAYPRECPYPHLSASAASMKGDSWIRPLTDAASVKPEVVEAYVTAAGDVVAVNESFEIPWSDQEDLFTQGAWLDAERYVQDPESPSPVLYQLCLVLVMATTMTGIWRAVASAGSPGKASKEVHTL